MAYLMPEYEGPGDGGSYFRAEILRLQELCADNFAKIDVLKKENKKLQDLHTELKETTSDLAYSLAECPWWEKESLEAAVKILASFAQKIQYILELPTFIDPVEQLNRNAGKIGSPTSKKKASNSNGLPQDSSSSGLKTCRKCSKKFFKIENYESHKKLHPPNRLKCKLCSNKFKSFGSLRIHLNTVHAFNPLSKTNEETYSSLREKLQRNHVRVWRFFKCQYCETACSSLNALKRHFQSCKVCGKYCRSKSSKTEETAKKSSNNNEEVKTVNGGPKPRHEDSSEEEVDKKPRRDTEEPKTGEPLTVAEAPVRLAAVHSFSISSTPTSSASSSSNSVEADGDDISADLPPHYLSSSSSSVDSDMEPSIVKESGTGTILMKYICSHHQCCQSFSTRAKLVHHRKCHRKRTEELLSCQVCGKEFHDKYRLKTHWFTHCPNGFAPKPMYRCLECGKIHRNLNDLADHSQKAHPVSKLPRPLYSCSSCGFRTNLRRKFDIHLKQKCKNRHNFPTRMNHHHHPQHHPHHHQDSAGLLSGVKSTNVAQQQQSSTSFMR